MVFLLPVETFFGMISKILILGSSWYQIPAGLTTNYCQKGNKSWTNIKEIKQKLKVKIFLSDLKEKQIFLKKNFSEFHVKCVFVDSDFPTFLHEMAISYFIFFRQIGATRKQSCAYHPVRKMASSFEKDFCGGEFWNSNKTWNTDSPDFTPWSDFSMK